MNEHSVEIDAAMRTLLSEADSGAMGWRDRLDAAMALVAQAWDEGYDRGMRDEISDLEPADNPYRTRVTPPEGT